MTPVAVVRCLVTFWNSSRKSNNPSGQLSRVQIAASQELAPSSQDAAFASPTTNRLRHDGVLVTAAARRSSHQNVAHAFIPLRGKFPPSNHLAALRKSLNSKSVNDLVFAWRILNPHWHTFACSRLGRRGWVHFGQVEMRRELCCIQTGNGRSDQRSLS